MQDKKLKEYIIAKLRENGDLKRIYRNIFISYITKNLDNYIKYFDEALQWVKKNNIKSDEMAQWIKENNIQQSRQYKIYLAIKKDSCFFKSPSV